MYVKEKIVGIFNDYSKYLLEIGDKAYLTCQDFTATLLLKMEHRKFIIFDKYTIETYQNLPISSLNT